MNQFTLFNKRKTIAKVTSIMVVLAMFAGTGSVFGETNEEAKQSEVQQLKERENQILENVQSITEEVRASLKKELETSEEERMRTEEFISVVQQYVDLYENGEIQLEENQSFDEGLTEYLQWRFNDEENESIGLDCLCKPVIMTYRCGYNVRMVFLSLNDNGSNIQIWGKNNKNHFLIKDYGVPIGGCIVKTYTWDLTDYLGISDRNKLGNKLEQPEYIETGGVIEEIDPDLDNIGLYITIKNPNDGRRIQSYYKNFSLINGNTAKEINLVTSYDDPLLRYNRKWDLYNQFNRNRNTNYNSQFSAIALKGVPFRMKLFKDYGEVFKKYTIKVKGWNDSENGEVQLTTESCLRLTDAYQWTPEHDGVFNIVVYEGENPIIVRKVYVRAKEDFENDELLNINGMTVGDNNGNMEVKVNASNFYNSPENPAQIALRVGEESVWSRVVKNYDQVIQQKIQVDGDLDGEYDDAEITLSETQNQFEVNSGEYVIDALLKKQKSIEHEDIARRLFAREKLDGLFKFNETTGLTNELPGEGELARIGQQYQFRMVFDESSPLFNGNSDREFEYAFLIWDSRGKRLISDYSTENDFKYTFRDPGNYRVYLRARVAGNGKDKVENDVIKFRNSYIDEISMEVNVPMAENQDIVLKSVFVKNFSATEDGRFLPVKKASDEAKWFGRVDFTQTPKGEEKFYDGDNVKLVSHSKNVIQISARYENENLEVPHKSVGRLMYKVYAIHDGMWELVTPYTFEDTIPFYPRSEGTYKLLILVKDSISGAEQDRAIIQVEADNLLDN